MTEPSGTRDVYHLQPYPGRAGAMITKNGEMILGLPPRVCVLWAEQLLRHSELARLTPVSDIDQKPQQKQGNAA